MNKTVLIVEDSATQAIKTKFILESKGYKVFLAVDGSDGVSKAKELKPDLIVLDVYLPKLSGFEICKLLKSNLESRSIPIIMFSNENKLKNMVTAYEMGADYYVVKGEEGERVLTLLIETVFTRISRRMLQTS
ncbi:MAG: response regulator [Chloroflexota bacterium]|nr:response regulator [Chloroflexota bacterium]